MSRENDETIRHLYDRLMTSGALQDSAAAEIVPEFFDPAVEVRQSSSVLGTAGIFRGYRGLAEAAREVVQAFADVDFAPERVEASGDHVAVAVRMRATGRLSGAAVEMHLGHVWTLRHGRVMRFEVFDSPADAFGSVGLD